MKQVPGNKKKVPGNEISTRKQNKCYDHAVEGVK